MKIRRTILVTGMALAAGILSAGHRQAAYAMELPKAESAHFSDLNHEKGLLYGSVEFKMPANAADVTDYSIYFTDAKGSKLKYIGNVNIKSQNEGKEYLRRQGYDFFGDTYNFNVPDKTPLPAGADSFGIFAKNASGESDTGTLIHIWDAPVSLLENSPLVDENPLRGVQGALRWKVAPDQSEVTGYKVTYFNGTDWLPFEVSADLLKPGNKAYEIPFNTGSLSPSVRVLDIKVEPVTAAGGEAPAIYYDIVDDISGETSGLEVVTDGTPKFTGIRFTDNDSKVGVIGGQVRVEVEDREFLKSDYSSGGTSLMYSLYFLDGADKKIKGLQAKGAYLDAAGYYYFQIPEGTPVPKGAKSLGIFAAMPTVEGADFAKAELRDNGGNDHYAQDVRFIDRDPAKESTKGVITWKASPHEEELKGYALFAGDDTEPFATVPKGASPYASDVPEWYKSGNGGVLFKVIPVNADGSYSYSINFKDGYTYLSDAFGSGVAVDPGRVDQYAKGFTDEDNRPGLLKGQLSVGGYAIAEQGDVDIYFYDQLGNRIAQIGRISYSGHNPQKAMYFVIPDGTPVPEQAVYIGSSAKDADGVSRDVAYYISDNVLTDKPVFRDVQPAERGYMFRMIEFGILTGFDDGTLRPGDKVTRAQFAAMLARAFKLEAGSEAAAFPDVEADAWYAGAVAAAVNHGLLQGYEDGTFRPDQTLARKEMFVILYRLRQEREKEPFEQDPSYVDYIVKQYKGGDSFPDWVKQAIARLSLDSVIYKWEDLKLDEQASRDDVATALIRLLCSD